jgi:hypothetical protein
MLNVNTGKYEEKEEKNNKIPKVQEVRNGNVRNAPHFEGCVELTLQTFPDAALTKYKTSFIVCKQFGREHRDPPIRFVPCINWDSITSVHKTIFLN